MILLNKTKIYIFIIFFSLKSFGFGFGFGSSIKFKDVPENIEGNISEIFYSIDTGSKLSLSTLQPLINFVLSEHSKTKAWRLKKRWEAEAAATTIVLPYEFQEIITSIFRTNTPDYATLFPVLKYSEIEDFENYTFGREKCVFSKSKTNTIEAESYNCIEYTTPNFQSGACFYYTNTRTLIRGNLNGNDILISASQMHPPSSYSTRGISVGPPEDNLFYISNIVGINLTGLKWARSQIYVSRTLAIYVKAPNNQTVVMLITWLAAGWNQINITKTLQIYEVLEQTLKSISETAKNRDKINKSLEETMGELKKMSDVEINKIYKKYCDYVGKCLKKGAGGTVTSKQAKLLKSLYDKKTLETMPMKYRKALILQEKVRVILGKPTWSGGK